MAQSGPTVPATPSDRIDFIVEFMRRGVWTHELRSRFAKEWGVSWQVMAEAIQMSARVVRAEIRADGFVEGLTGGYLAETMGSEKLEPKDRLRAAELLLKYFPPKLEGTDEEYAAQCRAEFDRLSKDDDE